MLKKLFVIILFGMNTIFSGDPKSDEKRRLIVFHGKNIVALQDKDGYRFPIYLPFKESDLLSERVEFLKNKYGEDIKEVYKDRSNFKCRDEHVAWEILAQHQKIDGRKFDEFYAPKFLILVAGQKYIDPVYREHPAYNQDNMLRLCKLKERPYKTKLLAPFWDDIAIEPIFSQYQTVASSDLSLKHSINFLKLMLIVSKEMSYARRIRIGASYHIKTAKRQKLIQANWGDIRPGMLTKPPAESLIINDTLDAETRDKLSKSGLFVAQIYTELLKKRPREVDGVRIIYLSEPEEVDEVKISYPSESTQESSYCSIQ